MKLKVNIKRNKTAILRLGRGYVRRTKRMIFRSHFSRALKKYLRMDAKKALSLAFRQVAFQISIRPRLKLAFRAIAVLVLIFVSTIHLSRVISENKQEVKVNGQAVMVAEASLHELEPEMEISSVVGSKLSPFDYINPVEHGLVSQGFASYHRGLDIATSLGSEIKPIGRGVVEFTGFVPDGKGNIVIVDHGDGLKTLYAHMGRIEVGVGNGVDGNTVLGTVGMTGRTTGPHLHLEVYDGDVAMNPVSVLP